MDGNGEIVTEPISIHALREEGDFFFPVPLPLESIFLSTPSARRATVSVKPD